MNQSNSSSSTSTSIQPWEQQHVSSIKVIGVVREVIPISFREIHFVVDCDQQTATTNCNNAALNAPRQKNWVDVHATETWAARCSILAVGDKVQLQYFGVYRPVTSQVVATHLLATNNNNNSKSNKSLGSSNQASQNHQQGNSSNEPIQYWIVPENRKSAAPFVLSPVVMDNNTAANLKSGNGNDSNLTAKKSIQMSTFVVERGQQLILHDDIDDDQENNQKKQSNASSHQELNVRTQGSFTPQQIFMKSVQNYSTTATTNEIAVSDESDANGSNNTNNNNNTRQITSVGNSIGKNLFSNVFRFVDVMRGLNSNLLPLLRKLQKVCAGAQHVLDAGCGSGLISFAIKCSDPNGPEIVATDRSRAMSALVQEKNQSFVGLMASASSQNNSNSKSISKSSNNNNNATNISPSRSHHHSHHGGRHHHKDHLDNNNNNNNSSQVPLVQFVLGDLSASPDRFIVLPGGASATEVAVGGRKQFDVLLCIDVLSFLPSIEAMKRALFNLALHAKPKAKLVLSVPNLLACAEDAIKLQQQQQGGGGASNSNSDNQLDQNSNGNSNNAGASDYETRPKTQRALHFAYDRHKLSLGSSTMLSQGGVLDVVERQYYDMLSLDGSSYNNATTTKQPDANSSSNINKKSDASSPTSSNQKAKTASSSVLASSSEGSKKLLRRYTEWFGFSCPNNSTANYQQQKQTQNQTSSPNSADNFQPNSNTGSSSPQIFYEALEELILHPTFLESLFEDMGWKVEEVWLFDALERSGEFAEPGVNTLAVLGAVPGGSSANGLGGIQTMMLGRCSQNQQEMQSNSNNNNNSSQLQPSFLISPTSTLSPNSAVSQQQKVGFDDAATENNMGNKKNFQNAKSAQQIEAGFTHRLYTLVRKS